MSEMIVVWDWFELQQELCDLMGIDFDSFSRYHTLIGGEYKKFVACCSRHDCSFSDAKRNDRKNV